MLNDALRLIRIFHDFKSAELAKKLGISQSYLSEIETGKKTPSMEIISRYAEVFHTIPSAILFFSEALDDKKQRGPFKLKMRNTLLKFLQAIENAQIETVSD